MWSVKQKITIITHIKLNAIEKVFITINVLNILSKKHIHIKRNLKCLLNDMFIKRY